MWLKLGRAKFQPSSARETFSNWGLNEVAGKCALLQRKTGHILKTVKDTAKIAIYH